MITDQVKKQVLNRIFNILSDLSDLNYQKNAWVLGKGPGYAYDDTVCDFFDIGDPLLENYKEYGLTEKQYYILKDFRDKFEAFSDKNSWPPLFIDTPEWAQIMEEAKDVLKAFGYQKNR